MKHLTIVVPQGQSVLDSIVGTYILFSRAENIWREKNKTQVFQVELAGVSKEVELHNGLFSVRPAAELNSISRTDLVVIPALQPEVNFGEAVKRNKIIIDWVEKQYKAGAEVASICTGAFLLASTGLLNGRSCSTHWAAAEAFGRMFPRVNLITEKIITDENGIYTSGGAFSFLNFLLYLVEKYYDRETAIYCSKIFEIDFDRSSQSPFLVFRGQKKHNDEGVKKAQSYLENNFKEKISIEKLASDLAIGRRNFDRRFKKATGNSPMEYLKRIKMEAAKKSFESTRKTVKEVMFDVGYSDFKAFRTTFQKVTGLSPVNYRNKYKK